MDRPPPVCPPSPAKLSVKLLGAADIWRCVPVNALIVTDDESIFLAVTGALRDLSKVLLTTGLGYVFLGKISKETLFILNVGGKDVTPDALAVLQPQVIIWLGFCRSTAKYHRVGDVIIADKVLCRAEGKQHMVNKLECSDFLARVFHDGRFGWSTRPSARRQFVHREGIVQPATETDTKELLQLRDDCKTVAIAPPKSTDFLRTFSQGQQEWIALYGMVGDRDEASWIPYVAMVMSSFLCKVLRDDGIFSALEDDRKGEADLMHPVQETVSSYNDPVETHQKRARALASYSFVSQAPRSSVTENEQLGKKQSALDVKEKIPVENTCHSNGLPTVATVCKEANGGDKPYLPRPPADMGGTQLYRRFRGFRLAQPFIHAAESSGTAAYGNTKHQHCAKYKGARLLISRVLPPKTSSIHSGLACAVETVLPPVVRDHRLSYVPP